MRRDCLNYSNSFRSPAGSVRTARPKHRVRFTKVASVLIPISHAYGAAFDNPDLIVAVTVGDGEAETGPLATSWHSNKFLNPIRDGAVLPVLHLNGYKISNPTILARIPRDQLEALLTGYGHKPYFVEGEDPSTMHQQMASTMEQCILEIRSIQQHARSTGIPTPSRWPMVVLRSPKGWTGPKVATATKWRAPGGPTRSRCPTRRRMRSTWPSLKTGCANTSPKSYSTPTGGSSQSCRNSRLPGLAVSPLILTQTADYCEKNLRCRTFAISLWT